MGGFKNQSDEIATRGSNNTVIIDGHRIKKTKGNYCFPNFLGKAMSKVGQRIQYESSLISMTLILIGITVAAIVTIFGTDFETYVKVMAAINLFAAFVFLSSSLVTTFQQYQAYLSIMGILDVEDNVLNVKDNVPKEKDNVIEKDIPEENTPDEKKEDKLKIIERRNKT